MSCFAFLVHHRSVDLIGMTAASELRARAGMSDQLISLRRDDAYIVEGVDSASADAWKSACVAQAHWFNPNKHRFAMFHAAPGALDLAGGTTEQGAWPVPWVGDLVESDHPRMSASSSFAEWLDVGESDAGFVVTLASWDLDEGLGSLPHGEWPQREGIRLLRAQLWTARVRAKSADHALSIVEGFAVTRTRRQGLLIHPHMEGWAVLGA